MQENYCFDLTDYLWERLLAVLVRLSTALFVLLLTVAPLRAQVGNWEAIYKGDDGDNGVFFLTFGSDFTVSGHGISQSAFNVFDVHGTWSATPDGFVSEFIISNEVGTLAFFISGKARPGAKLSARGAYTGGTTFRMKAVPVTTNRALDGDWIAVASIGNLSGLFTFSAAPSQSDFGRTELDGDFGDVSFLGDFLITSRGVLCGYFENIIDDTDRTALFGKVDKTGSKLSAKVKETNGLSGKMKAARQ